MKKIKVKLIGMILISMLIISSVPLISKAAGAFTASISKTTVTVGDTFTVTVKASSAAGMYSVSASNSNVSITNSGSGFLDNSSETWTFKANKAGTVTITAKATDMTDAEDDTKSVTGSKTFTVTVKEKANNSNSGSSTNSNSIGNGGTTTTQEPKKPTFTSANKTVYTTGTVNLRSSWSTSSAATQVEKGTELKLTGTSNEKVNGYVWNRVEYKGSTKYIASNLITTTKPEEPEEEPDKKSDNNNLSSLTIEGLALTPTFEKDTLQYTAKVDENTTKVEVVAKAENSKATVKIQGNDELKEGENTIKIVVTAENGTTKTYTVKVTKEEMTTTTTPNSNEDLKLAELKIAGVNFENGFNPDLYTYDIPLNATVEKLDITAKANQEDAKIEILGNEDFKTGENLITILLTSADGTQTATYQVKVNIPEGARKAVDNTKIYIICGGAIGGSVILIIIIIVATLRKGGEEEETEEQESEEAAEPKKVQEDKVEEKELADITTEKRKPTLDEFLDTSELDEKPKKSKGRHSM